MKQVYEFMSNYLGHEVNMTPKELLDLVEDLYNSGCHPRVELFVEMNYDLFKELV